MTTSQPDKFDIARECPTYHKLVPKQRAANLRFRKEIVRYGMRGPAESAHVWKMCSRDILFYVNVAIWIYEPRDGRVLPWITYPFQDQNLLDLVASIKKAKAGERADTVQAKSRDMGATWMCLMACEWMWHFHDWNSFLLLSNKEETVDSPGNPKSLFWKLDFMHGRIPNAPGMPSWLMPRVSRTHMRLENLSNSSTFKGEATTKNSGVADRCTAMVLDEFTLMERQSLIVRGTRDVSRCRIFNFTVRGEAMTAKALTENTNMKQLRLHWTLHPEKARGLYRDDKGKPRSPWYDEECRSALNESEIATELDMEWIGAGGRYFDFDALDAIDRDIVREPMIRGDILLRNGDPREPEFIEQIDGPLLLWLSPRADGTVPAGIEFTSGVDVSLGTIDIHGTGSSNSSYSGWNRATGEKLVEYTVSGIDPVEFANRSIGLSVWLNNAFLKWETRGPGSLFGNQIVRAGYRNIYYRTNEFSLGKKVSDTPGWSPTTENKKTLFMEYGKALKSGSAVNRSRMSIVECRHYVFGSNMVPVHMVETEIEDPTLARENHGDRVTADALGFSECRVSVRKTPMQFEHRSLGEYEKPRSIATRRQYRLRESQKTMVDFNWSDN